MTVKTCLIKKKVSQMANTAGFGSIYLENYSRVFAYIYHLTNDRQLTEDITQETFVKAYNNLDSFRNESKLSVWLIKIAYNSLIDYKRHGANQFRFCADDELERLTAVSPSIAKEVETKVMSECVQSKVLLLPTDYRAPVFLDMNGYSNQEIADILGCTLATAKIRLHRARKKLKEVLGDHLLQLKFIDSVDKFAGSEGTFTGRTPDIDAFCVQNQNP